MSERGRYRSVSIGQAIPAPAIYVEREPTSVATWIIGAAAVGGSLLWARHQSRQIEQLYTKADLPYQGFTTSLREGAVSSLRGLAERVRPKRLPRKD